MEIRCHNCGTENSYLDSDEAKEEGWKKKGGDWYCEDCKDDVEADLFEEEESSSDEEDDDIGFSGFSGGGMGLSGGGFGGGSFGGGGAAG